MNLRRKAVAAAAAALLASAAGALDARPASASDIGSGIDHRCNAVIATDYQAQQHSNWSGPAATRIALTARGKYPTQATLAEELGTTASGTSDVSPVNQVLIASGAGPYRAIHTLTPLSTTGQDLMFSRLVASIENGRPVVAEIRIHQGSAATPPGYSLTTSYLDTFVTITGYDDGKCRNPKGVYVVDPASTSKSYWMEWSTFVQLMPAGGYTYDQ